MKTQGETVRRRGITDEAKFTERITPAMEQEAAKRAKNRAASVKWDLNVVVLLMAVLVSVIILNSIKVGVEIVGLVAIFGLSIVWLVGWRWGKRLYRDLYDEELLNVE